MIRWQGPERNEIPRSYRREIDGQVSVALPRDSLIGRWRPQDEVEVVAAAVLPRLLPPPSAPPHPRHRLPTACASCSLATGRREPVVQGRRRQLRTQDRWHFCSHHAISDFAHESRHMQKLLPAQLATSCSMVRICECDQHGMLSLLNIASSSQRCSTCRCVQPATVA